MEVNKKIHGHHLYFEDVHELRDGARYFGELPEEAAERLYYKAKHKQEAVFKGGSYHKHYYIRYSESQGRYSISREEKNQKSRDVEKEKPKSLQLNDDFGEYDDDAEFKPMT